MTKEELITKLIYLIDLYTKNEYSNNFELDVITQPCGDQLRFDIWSKRIKEE